MDAHRESERLLRRTQAEAQRRLNVVAIRLLANVLVGESGCWIWQGAQSGDMTVLNRRIRATHVAYAILVAPLPDGWFKIRRRCGNPRCLHPLHLFIARRE